MSLQKSSPSRVIGLSVLRTFLFVIVGGLFLTAGLVSAMAYNSLAGTSLGSFFSWLFAANTVQLMWYITRAAGIMAYVLLWLSTAWGLAVASKIFDPVLHRAITYDFHQFISLLGIGFLALHLIVLALDQYLPYSIPQVLVPFLSPYRPFWVGIGGIAFYLILLVTVTFYMRNWIGGPAFRAIHTASLIGYLGATIHGFFSGTDSSLIATQLLYASTFLVVVFLTAYWLLTRSQKRRIPVPAAQKRQPSS